MVGLVDHYILVSGRLVSHMTAAHSHVGCDFHAQGQPCLFADMMAERVSDTMVCLSSESRALEGG